VVAVGGVLRGRVAQHGRRRTRLRTRIRHRRAARGVAEPGDVHHGWAACADRYRWRRDYGPDGRCGRFRPPGSGVPAAAPHDPRRSRAAGTHECRDGRPADMRRFVLAFGAVALLLAGGLSYLAYSAPDGLESVAHQGCTMVRTS